MADETLLRVVTRGPELVRKGRECNCGIWLRMSIPVVDAGQEAQAFHWSSESEGVSNLSYSAKMVRSWWRVASVSFQDRDGTHF